ncbi:MAG: DctP family TRAP transporter solute-binding subunit [Chloroflexi bacterium]|nr:DctP family TRAP transporter solute-binding subunit [Chloroflexota bacterium]
MKKISVLLAVIVLLILVSSVYGVADQKTYTIGLSNVVSEAQSSYIASNEIFKPYVEKESGGRIKVELYPNGQLGGDRESFEAVQVGTREMHIGATAVLSGFLSEVQVFDLPYLFKSKEVAYKALDGELGTIINNKLLDLGLKNLGYMENGYRHISNNKGPITKPSDLKGLKIRTMENPVHMAIFKAFGANPTPMNFGELYTALQQGTVDAQENPIPLVYTSKFYEVQKYYTLDGHVYASASMVINKDFFNNLPEDLQEIIVTGAKKAIDFQRELADKQDEEMLKLLKEKGMVINELTSEQKQGFIDASIVVYDQFKDIIGENLIEMAKKANK